MIVNATCDFPAIISASFPRERTLAIADIVRSYFISPAEKGKRAAVRHETVFFWFPMYHIGQSDDMENSIQPCIWSLFGKKSPGNNITKSSINGKKLCVVPPCPEQKSIGIECVFFSYALALFYGDGYGGRTLTLQGSETAWMWQGDAEQRVSAGTRTTDRQQRQIQIGGKKRQNK